MTEWPPISKIAAHSDHGLFSKYKVPDCSLSFSHLGFWSGKFFLIALFPDYCLFDRFIVLLVKCPQVRFPLFIVYYGIGLSSSSNLLFL